MKDGRREYMKNRALINSCGLHDFAWKERMAAAIKRREELEQKTGVSVPFYPSMVKCRCKNCGGKVSAMYAGAYMDAVHHMRRIYEQSTMSRCARTVRQPAAPTMTLASAGSP